MRLETYTLAISAYGSTDNLHFVPLARSQPGEREVEIEVRATGLNFKDVLHALGMLEVAGSQSGVDNASQMAFGGDCSGVVTRVGAKVTRIRPGDEVTAIMAFGCFASHVVVPEHFVATKPAGWSHVEAAAVPTAYATAYHSLVTCARLRREETVLIHAAAGGVGLAATQLALQIGAKVYATASRSKHALLRALGVAHIYDSRSVSFADEMQRDGAAPVDVVLNSLNGAFIQPTLRALRPGGRFVEIGKIGVMTPDEAARARPDIDYFLFDLMDVALRDPDSVVQALNASLSLLVRERLRPVRTERFPISQVKRAFRRMAEGRHAGKIVVTHPDRTRGDGVDAEGWQVLSGGLGGIGRELAHWLARHGARRIAFISRRAPGGAVWDELQSRCGAGVVLRHYAADVADQQKLRGVLASLAAEAPIADIHHLAGALHDGLLEGQTFDDFADVFRSKLISGLNLHAASLEVEHARFIAHSSVAGVFGSAGQTNYAAANAALDALMQHRRALGLHGLSVNWGPWGHAGMATRLREVDRQRLERDGVTPLSPDEALSELQSLVAADADRAVVGRIDWNRANSAYPGGLPPCLQDIDASGPGRTDDVMALSSLVELPEQERVARMTDATRLLLSPVLRLPPEDISPAATLPELGLDSLMGMEFRHRLERWIGRPIPIASLIRGPSVSDLAAELLALAALTPQAHRDTGVGPARVASRWLLRIGGPQTDAPRLLCFHHLGGGADFFRRWAEPLLDVCEVFAVELPGRNARASESLIATTDVLYDAITPIIATWPARPLLLYGHSMGSHLAFGCAQRLSALRCPPAHLFISGLWAPIDHHHEREAEHLGGRDLQHIEIPAALRLDAAFMKSLRTLIRSDAALLRSADWQGAPPLHVPLTAFSGLDDPVAPGDKVARWAKCTKAAFEHIELPGRHMFIVESAPAIHERIRLALGELPSADLHAAQRLVR